MPAARRFSRTADSGAPTMPESSWSPKPDALQRQQFVRREAVEPGLFGVMLQRDDVGELPEKPRIDLA